VVETAETVSDVSFDEPGRTRPGIGHFPQRGVTPPTGSKPVGSVGERWLVVRLQQQTRHFPDELVRPGRQAQRPSLPVLLRDVNPACWGKSVALVAHRIDDAADLPQGHAIHGFLRGPRGHRALVRINSPIGQQIQLRVEHLSIQLTQRQAAPAALTQDTQHRFGVLHYAYLPVLDCPITWPPSPMRTAFPSPLAGRDSGDYYEASVALGLAPVRRSHVRRCRTK
jgi:hypothetical protein